MGGATGFYIFTQDEATVRWEDPIPIAFYPVIPYNFSRYAGVAQLLERVLAKDEVQG